MNSERRKQIVERNPHAANFRDLIVYQKARAVSEEIFIISKHFPKEEIYSLTDQLRRSSRSIGAQIAEAWGKRRYEKQFVNKLTDADAEQYETQHWIETAENCAYLRKDNASELCDKLSKIGRMLNSMIDKSATFCVKDPLNISEYAAEYITQ